MKSEKVMALYKRKKELQEQIMYWQKFQGVNWLGKWGRSIRLERLKEKFGDDVIIYPMGYLVHTLVSMAI